MSWLGAQPSGLVPAGGQEPPRGAGRGGGAAQAAEPAGQALPGRHQGPRTPPWGGAIIILCLVLLVE